MNFEEEFDFSQKEINKLNRELKTLYVYNRYQKNKKFIIFLTNSLFEATKFYNYLKTHTSDVLFFPVDELTKIDEAIESPELMTIRLETLNEIAQNKPKILVTNLYGYLKFIQSKNEYIKDEIILKKSEIIKPIKIVEQADEAGYEKVDIVSRTGEYAHRGYIIDIFPTNSENPIRIEFFGDEIENIREFNLESQRTIKEIENITIPNFKEIISEKSTEAISTFAGSHELVIDEINTLTNHYKFIEKDLKETGKYSELKLEPNNYVELSSKHYEELPKIDKTTLKTLLSSKKNVFFSTKHPEKLNKMLDKEKVKNIDKKFNEGFQTEKTILLTDKELFQDETSNFLLDTRFRKNEKIENISKIEIGDYVVHYSFGIGKYLGLKKIEKDGLEKEYLKLEYKNKDSLYIPVEKIGNLRKYSSKDGVKPRLNKIGSSDWEKTKQKLNKKIENIAKDLLEVHAFRENQVGIKFEIDQETQKKFNEDFEYEPTQDQIKSYTEIIADMAKPYPMDRLLCGDVGYGKTEVAFRAAFNAITNNKQVALLCPTTILSDQHYQNALKRFSNFPIKIEILNRFVTQKKVLEIKQKLKEGRIDFVIGTHKLLSKDIEFKNLGLLIVDEEQRFGVKHKEKIKAQKRNIDVLTLSATPIPRTLQMSFSGVRELSLIETPPQNKYPIQTYVLEEDFSTIKEILYKEKSRNGQSYILCNNTKQIEKITAQLAQMAPDLKMVYAHGQMPKTKLENVMKDFKEQKFDVLVCTTIIETGIDIPRVNSLVILDSDNLGLAQLYQIRGRVGRGGEIAYAYLMYKKGLTEIAKKRLETIKKFTRLGSGFSIAMRDLSLRGAGDILGQEQAGFIDSVGIELFLEMLEKEVKKQKGQEIDSETKNDLPLLNVKTSLNHLTDSKTIKIEFHQKITNVKTQDEAKELIEEIEDRFGNVNEEIKTYIYAELLENILNSLNITRVRTTKRIVEVTMPKTLTENINMGELFLKSQEISRFFKFSKQGNNILLGLDLLRLKENYIYILLETFQYIKKQLSK